MSGGMRANLNERGDVVGFSYDEGCCHNNINEGTAKELALKAAADLAAREVPHRYPSTTKELLEFANTFFAECVEIAHQRNVRYAGAYDPFRNFRLGGDYGIAIRMTDKVSRLLTLTEPHTTIDGGDESIEDTCRDLANYAMLLAAMRRNEGGTR